jgi:transposase
MTRLGGWAGYEVSGWRHEQRGERRWLVMELAPLEGVVRRCSGCGATSSAVHDRTVRRIRDLPVFDDPVELEVPRLRLACGTCGPRLERLDWLDSHARVTGRMAQSVARLCATTSLRHAARWFGLDWKTVKRIDFAHLERTLGPVDLTGVTVIAMDEFAIQKGHRYATLVVEPERKRVLWVGRGRARADVRPFFELLGPEGCRRLRAVAIWSISASNTSRRVRLRWPRSPASPNVSCIECPTRLRGDIVAWIAEVVQTFLRP